MTGLSLIPTTYFCEFCGHPMANRGSRGDTSATTIHSNGIIYNFLANCLWGPGGPKKLLTLHSPIKYFWYKFLKVLSVISLKKHRKQTFMKKIPSEKKFYWLSTFNHSLIENWGLGWNCASSLGRWIFSSWRGYYSPLNCTYTNPQKYWKALKSENDILLFELCCKKEHFDVRCHF